MSLAVKSPCKVNLLLNVTGLRADGFHEVETVLLPVPLFDELQIEKAGAGIELTCSNPRLSVGGDNLVHRAATKFLEATGIGGANIHLQKNLPLAAGIGAGSSNAAWTLRGLNELHENPLPAEQLHELAAALGSDVPFFLQDNPALATGRGDVIAPLEHPLPFAGRGLLLAWPGFGVDTPWTYQALAEAGDYQARGNLDSVLAGDCTALFNSLEAPVFEKFAVLPVIKDFFLSNGALGALMSGSGSTMLALAEDRPAAEALRAQYHERFGQAGWSATLSL